MTQICEEIYNAGIKLIIVDRPIESDKYTALLGGDNILPAYDKVDAVAVTKENVSQYLQHSY